MDGRHRGRRRNPIGLRWPQEEALAAVFEGNAHFKDGGLTLTPGAALIAATSLWDTPPPRKAILWALRAIALSSLDRDAFAGLVRHVIVSFEVIATLETSASAAWSIAEAGDDYRLTLQEFARAARALKCKFAATTVDSGTSEQPYLDRCAAVFALMPSHTSGFVRLEELVEWIAPQRARIQNGVLVQLHTKSARSTPQPMSARGQGLRFNFTNSHGAQKTSRQHQRMEAAAVNIQKSWRASAERARLVRSWSLEAAVLRAELGRPGSSPEVPFAPPLTDTQQVTTAELAAVRIQAAYRGSAVRKPPEFPDESDESETESETDSDANSFSPPPSPKA